MEASPENGQIAGKSQVLTVEAGLFSFAHSPAQLRVLVRCKLQPNGASAHADPVFDRLTAGQVEFRTAVPGKVQDLQFALEDEVAG